ncbi:putative LRR receptor-like serine/threonine-protein kinase RFK1 [Citrus sinensis]|nr:putative LRR receptor-like serine/threonine-protein kinase RFK1 [Citrus sinensis]
MLLFFKRFLLLVLVMSCFWAQIFAAAKLPRDEVDVLNQIAQTMGATNWTFGSDACEDHVTIKQIVLTDPLRNITCNCQFQNETCHIIAMEFMRFSLPGTLPPQIVNLPYLENVDFAYNYLHGSIPREWASMQLKYISVFANRLSGNIPSHLGNITSLTYLDLEENQFSGTIPQELGNFVNLETLRLSSNRLIGNLPMELVKLKNLTDFRINDNNFNGSVPDFIQSWTQLNRLEIQGSGLEGPIPPSISALDKLNQLRISDLQGMNQTFPMLRNMTGLTRIILRNCNISGEIPEYIWGIKNLRFLDLSFNHLTGELPDVALPADLKFTFLTGNSIQGNVPESILKKGTNVDLSYNNFTWQSPEQPACREKPNLNLNLFRSSSVENNLRGVFPCTNNFTCHRYWHSLHINCGGGNVKVNDSTFEGDAGVGGGAATYHLLDGTNWGISSTGDFTDDDDEQNTNYIANSQSSGISELYNDARISPLSLTYIGYCLENGNYSVALHFAEIQFTNDKTYKTLGRRIFDIYIQDKLVEKDFNIEAEAHGVLKPITRPFTANVSNHILEIRFQWAGKGTTAIPIGGVYGPLISAISVDPNFKPLYGAGKKTIAPIVAGVIIGSCLIILVLGIFCWRHYFRTKSGRQEDLEGLEFQASSFTLKQIRAATSNFDPMNKIGEGGFGPVYKGQLTNGTIIAVKQLSSKSRQGNREFLNEIAMISCLQHPNLVKIHGCCVEGDQLLLVYEYMENNSLAHALFGGENSQLKLNWPVRQKICLGIARGLAFLHEESRFKIVHRDIKATNVLLDRDLNPKISDFGLAKLDEEEKTHISTRVAGTIGYMAPEYALWGYLTYKADVYSFGVVALEIVSGKNNMSYVPDSNCTCPLDWAFHLHRSGTLMELVDPRLGSEFNKVEAERMIKIALLCTNASPSLRPTMSEVVSMLEGSSNIPDVIPEAGGLSEDLRFKTLRDHPREMNSSGLEGSLSHYSSSASFLPGSSSTDDVREINAEAYLKFKAMRDSHIHMERQRSVAQLSTPVPSWTGSSKSAHDLHNTI